MKAKIYKGKWNVEDVSKQSDRLFVYGDNQLKIGKKGQAIIRNVVNSVGIATKKSPSERSSAYFTDSEYDRNKESFIYDVLNIKYRSISENRILTFSSNGYGNGLAEMEEKAPNTFNFFNDFLLYNFSFDNSSGKLVKKIPGYDEIKKAKYIDLSKVNKDIIIPANNSFFKQEYLEEKLLTLYDLIISGKKIAFTHKKDIVFNPDDIVIFKFDNILNYILVRISYSFDLKYVDKIKWETFEGFRHDENISDDYIQTHFQYISILDSNNNMILPGDLFSDMGEFLKSDKDKEIFFDKIINADPPNEKLKRANDNFKKEQVSNEDQIIEILKEIKNNFVTKKELEELLERVEEIEKRNFWKSLFGK